MNKSRLWWIGKISLACKMVLNDSLVYSSANWSCVSSMQLHEAELCLRLQHPREGTRQIMYSLKNYKIIKTFLVSNKNVQNFPKKCLGS
jgi:hypothetical protein